MSTIISAGTTTNTAYNVNPDTSGSLVLATGSGATTAVTIDTSQNTTLAGYLNTPNTFGFKNRIINGAMVIDQRNNGASVTYGSGTTAGNYYGYNVDRWWAQSYTTTTGAGVAFTVQQNAGSITPPAGFTNYLGVTVTTAHSPVATTICRLQQPIEGFNVSDLGWGTSNAKPVTLSFWVYSSLTGTFGGTISNSGGTRYYVFSYSIPAANTWTQISVTILGDTSGTWLTNNGIGIGICWSLGADSASLGSTGSWGSTGYFGATGQVNLVGTNGATFYITGVQLEKGSTATSFDYRPYGTELALCQRYYYRVTTSQSYSYYCSGGVNATTDAYFTKVHPVPMRAIPTVYDFSAINTFRLNCASYSTLTSIGIDVPDVYTCSIHVAGTGFTIGQPAQLGNGVGTTSYVGFGAEL